MGSKTRLGSYCTKRANNGVNLVTSRNINTRLARPIWEVVLGAPDRVNIPCLMHDNRLCQLDVTMTNNYHGTMWRVTWLGGVPTAQITVKTSCRGKAKRSV